MNRHPRPTSEPSIQSSSHSTGVDVIVVDVVESVFDVDELAMTLVGDAEVVDEVAGDVEVEEFVV